MKAMLFLAGFLLYALAVHADLSVSEVMYDPPGSDNMKEWIECSGSDDLSQIIIGDGVVNDTLVLMKAGVGNYSLIVEDGFDVESVNCSVYSAGAIIMQGLRNDGGKIYVWKDDVLLDSVEYPGDIAQGTGESIVRTADGFVASFLMGGSPCVENPKVSENDSSEESYDLALSVILPQEVFLSVEQTSLFKIQNRDHESGVQENISVFVDFEVCRQDLCVAEGFFETQVSSSVSARTGEFLPSMVGNFTLCGKIRNASKVDPRQDNNIACKNFSVVDASQVPCAVSLDLVLEKDIFAPGEQIVFYNRLTDAQVPYEITYSITRGDGSEVKNVTTSNQAKKTYTPSKDAVFEAFIFENRIDKIMCANQDAHTSNRKIVLVRSMVAQDSKSVIEIASAGVGSDNIAYFGERITPKIRVFKADTLKKSISVRVEGDSRITDPVSFSVDTKYSDLTVGIPLVLDDACSLPEGTYVLKVEGLDTAADADILIQHKGVCSEQDVVAKSASSVADVPLEEKSPILSFYTLVKKVSAGQKIKLFARVDASEERTLLLVNTREEEVVFEEAYVVETAKEPMKLTFDVVLVPGENVFSLVERDRPASVKEIVLMAESSPVEDIVRQALVPDVKKIRDVDIPEKEPTSIPVTGNVIYETGPVKYLNILLVIVVVLAGFIVWRERRKHEKGRNKGTSGKRVCTDKGHVRGPGKPERARGRGAQGVSQADQGRVADKDSE